MAQVARGRLHLCSTAIADAAPRPAVAGAAQSSVERVRSQLRKRRSERVVRARVRRLAGGGLPMYERPHELKCALKAFPELRFPQAP